MTQYISVSLIWHITILGLYDSPDSVMEAIQNYPHQRLAACSPDRLLHSPDLHRLHLCHDSISPDGRDGRIVFQSVILILSTARIPSRSQINRFVYDDRFSIICNNLYLHSYTTFSLCLDVIHAHCIGQADATSGLDIVAIFRVSMGWN